LDCVLLQRDLNNLANYCDNNYLLLNTKKCNFISFTRKSKTIKFDYTLNGETLARVTEVRDLGIVLDNKLSFNQHIDSVTARAFRMLGFVLRTGGDFKQCSTQVLLYNSFVRSNLEYASTVWSPHYGVAIDAIERIQNKFQRHLVFRASRSGRSAPIMASLRERRLERDQIFLYKIIRNHVDSPFLLGNVSLRCPRAGSRSMATFSIPFSKSNYVRNTFLFRSCAVYNNVFKDIDLFKLNLVQFKRQIREKLYVSDKDPPKY
jgi:hypothetical protein